MKISFKTFMLEATAQAEVLAVVRRMLGMHNPGAVVGFSSSEHIDEKLLKGAKPVSHKYVDTNDGPWVVELMENGEHIFVRAQPPKEKGGKPQYFIPKIEESIDEMFTEAEIVLEAKLHNVIGTIYGSNKFSFKDKTFSAEASDLGPGSHFLKPVFNDAADVGFRIESVKTGEQAVFTLHKEHKDADNDVTHWEFHVYNPTHNTKLNGLKAVIFND